ncbi:sensor histidine kinase [Sphingosinicella sp. BN140058]|uniref:sensor histidine kinase n=1 Tax=Sphingosinicella sp. BN140058 TaxID=1892855 RepID=UPI0010127903|nr:sensor histidine kinase [Sphingosinicella sp. BN140058]QAY75833.1 sensor histidine kinase [Sphingosinicella sp. BN140058]
MATHNALWQNLTMTGSFKRQQHWIFCIAALAVWVAWGWPILTKLAEGGTIRSVTVSPLWLVAYLVFGSAILGAMGLKLRPRLHWALLWLQLGCVVAMTLLVPWAGMSTFLVIIAWQVAMATSTGRALGWIAFQTLAIIAALAQAISPDLCWVVTESLALQVVLFLTATAMRREEETGRALARTNRELRSAQAIIANSVRDAERLRISRELHDAWGHELTALGLQLEIASHVKDPERVDDHVAQAKSLARALLVKVRDVVSALRDTEDCNLKAALEALAHSVPAPRIHVEMAPDVRVGSEQAHALMRCAQEAVTNAVRHARADNLWLQVTPDGDGVRLVARDDGGANPAAATPGSGLRGMRERIEALGGRLAIRADLGFTVEAWLPSEVARIA